MGIGSSCSRCRKALLADASNDLCANCRVASQSGAAPETEATLSRLPEANDPTPSKAATLPLDAATADLDATKSLDAATATVNHEGVLDRAVKPSPGEAAFGNYEVIEEVGRGAMGVVFKARQLRAERFVALKVIKDGNNVDGVQRERFRTEAQALARLQHPNIVQVFEVGEERGCPFFSMEFVDGGSLSRKIKADGPLAPAEAARLTEALAHAVEAAHRLRVLHRDLKPSNILLTTDGSPKVSDFGLAKRLDAEDGMTQAGALLGTPSYMAPEQAAGMNNKVGPHTDVYALGAILYEMLVGRPPFRDESPMATMQRVLDTPLVPPRSRRQGVPPVLEAICVKCLEKEPLRRYASAAELAGDLARWRRGEPTVARPLSAMQKVGRFVRRRPWLTAALIVLPLVAAGYGYVWWNEPLRSIERGLSYGHAVTLVSATGLPKWYRWERGEVPLTTSLVVSDGACSFQAVDGSVLELLPDPQCDRYRLTAELRQDAIGLPGEEANPAAGSVGLYVAARYYPEAGLRVRSHWLAVSFSESQTIDPNGVPMSNYLRLQDRLTFAEPDGRSSVIGPEMQRQKFTPIGFGHRWRKIVIEMYADHGEAFWEDDNKQMQRIAKWTPAVVQAEWVSFIDLVRSRTELPDLQLRPPPPRAPLGVFAHDRGAISFRNVVLEPSPAAPVVAGVAQ
jgi:hypothetical protein